MKKNELERVLQKVPPHTKPRADLEQYSTPATIAADMLFIAHSNGDIEGCKVVDLGCGSGIFSIGASLLGAGKVVGVDIDPEALTDARKNAEAAGADIELLQANIEKLEIKADTVVMNPPFGAQKRNADRPFLETAIRTAPKVYSLHNAATLPFLDRMVRALNARIYFQKSYKFEIPHMFEFHDRKKKEIEVVLLCISSLDVKK